MPQNAPIHLYVVPFSVRIRYTATALSRSLQSLREAMPLLAWSAKSLLGRALGASANLSV